MPSNTAFRGFGGPQAMMAMEQIVDHVAQALGRPAADVRAANMYQVGGQGALGRRRMGCNKGSWACSAALVQGTANPGRRGGNWRQAQ